MKHILFVCAANLNRSPTFEKFFKEKFPQYETKSAGIYYGYPHKLNDELLYWADVVYVMDLSQKMFIDKNYPQFLHKVKVIGISDQYDVDSPELIELIEYWIKDMQ